MKSQLLKITVWCNIAGEASVEIWNWSLLRWDRANTRCLLEVCCALLKFPVPQFRSSACPVLFIRSLLDRTFKPKLSELKVRRSLPPSKFPPDVVFVQSIHKWVDGGIDQLQKSCHGKHQVACGSPQILPLKSHSQSEKNIDCGAHHKESDYHYH